MLFVEDYADLQPEQLVQILSDRVRDAGLQSMVVTMGAQGAVYATADGQKGVCPARNVVVKDTTGAGDAFCAGVSIGLTYGKSMPEAIELGSMLAASVITSTDNVCPRFQPEELGISLKRNREK